MFPCGAGQSIPIDSGKWYYYSVTASSGGDRSTHLNARARGSFQMVAKTKTLTRKSGKLERFPEFPPRVDMQNWRYLYRRAITSALEARLKRKANVAVMNEVPIGQRLPARGGIRIPDLSVAFDADLELIFEQRGYDIEKQDKPPEFVLEVASETTGAVDYTIKRMEYERLAVFEYWRFDPSGGRYHDAALAGDRLVDGRYEPIEVAIMPNGELRGYSEALGLYLCWSDGMLIFHDPESGEYLLTHDEDIERADREAARADVAETRADIAESLAETEAARRRSAESTVAELREEIRRLRGE